MARQSRSEVRSKFPSDTRVFWLEQDADGFDEVLTGLKEDIKSVKNILVGVLISVTTASILLVINVLVVKN